MQTWHRVNSEWKHSESVYCQWNQLRCVSSHCLLRSDWFLLHFQHPYAHESGSHANHCETIWLLLSSVRTGWPTYLAADDSCYITSQMETVFSRAPAECWLSCYHTQSGIVNATYTIYPFIHFHSETILPQSSTMPSSILHRSQWQRSPPVNSQSFLGGKIATLSRSEFTLLTAIHLWTATREHKMPELFIPEYLTTGCCSWMVNVRGRKYPFGKPLRFLKKVTKSIQSIDACKAKEHA